MSKGHCMWFLVVKVDVWFVRNRVVEEVFLLGIVMLKIKYDQAFQFELTIVVCFFYALAVTAV